MTARKLSKEEQGHALFLQQLFIALSASYRNIKEGVEVAQSASDYRLFKTTLEGMGYTLTYVGSGFVVKGTPALSPIDDQVLLRAEQYRIKNK